MGNNITALNQLTGTASAAQATETLAAGKFLPEPATQGVGIFRDVLDIARGVTSGVSGFSGFDVGELQELINLQLDAQMQMQETSMISNIERSKHEARMSAVRNIRVS